MTLTYQCKTGLAVLSGVAVLAVAGAAALDLLPDWAAALHDRRAPPLARPAIRAGADGMSRVLRWALRAP